MARKIKAEYIDGPRANERFDRAMIALFRVPKSVVTENIKKKPKEGKG
jgi:hypothetical protein